MHRNRPDQGSATRAAGHWKQGHCSAQGGGGSWLRKQGHGRACCKAGTGHGTAEPGGSRMMTEAHCSGWWRQLRLGGGGSNGAATGGGGSRRDGGFWWWLRAQAAELLRKGEGAGG